MEQLTGQDAMALFWEKVPQHVAMLNLYDSSTAPGGRVSFAQILSHVGSRLHTARCFRQRLAWVPLNLDNPYWIEDPAFRLENHVRQVSLPAPGDWRALTGLVARLMDEPLDLSRPPWEMIVIEGLGGIDGLPAGAYATLTKVHHAAIDGATGAQITSALHDPSAEPAPAREPAPAWKADREPWAVELLGRAVWNNAWNGIALARDLFGLAPRIASVGRRFWQADVDGSPRTPQTRFNRTVSRSRVFDSRVFDLATIRQIRKAVPGATVNDVVLSVCAGAIRRYLDGTGELPAESLVTMAPVNVRREEERAAGGNQVSLMPIAIRTDVADPLERLAAVQRASANSKTLMNAVGARELTDLNKKVPAALHALAWKVVHAAEAFDTLVPVNCVISNVPGPQQTLYMNGARLVRWIGLGSAPDRIALGMPILSYDGRIEISFVCCREAMPDPEAFARAIEASFEEHRVAACGETASTSEVRA